MAEQDTNNMGGTLAELREAAPLSAAQAAQAVLAMAQSLVPLHQSGSVHRSVASIDMGTDGTIHLNMPEGEVELGGCSPDLDQTPPDMQRARRLRLPASMDAARHRLLEVGILLDPAQIDLYQLGAQLLKLSSGRNVWTYLHSPSAVRDVPETLKPLIDRLLGQRQNDAFQNMAALVAALTPMARADEASGDTETEPSVAPEGMATDLPASIFAQAIDSFPNLDPVTPREGNQHVDASAVVESQGISPEGEQDNNTDATTPSAGLTGASEAAGQAGERSNSQGVFGEASVAGGGSPAEEAGLPFETIGQFQVIELIGRGGMGDVYKARDVSLDRLVAVKVLPASLARDATFLNRFRAEAASIAKLAHPNVVQIYSAGESHGHVYFAMQYVEGESLADLLKRRPKLGAAEAEAILQQVLAGISAAHDAGLVHRDLKPGNILLDRNTRRALIADFGLAKAMSGQTAMTVTGVVMGTVDYIAPEQARGQGVDERSDLYAIGALMYHMLAGRPPFEADSAAALMYKHAFEPAPKLDEVATHVPPAVSRVVMKLLEKRPEDRYADSQAVRTAITQAMADKTGDAWSQRVAEATQLPEVDESLFATDEFQQQPSGTIGQKLRRAVMGAVRQKAPGLADQLENTQQQVDGAIDDYRARCAGLRNRLNEAKTAMAEFKSQEQTLRSSAEAAQTRAESSSDVASRAAALRHQQADTVSADELAQLTAEQAANVEQMQSALTTAEATLLRLESQRNALRTRLAAAEGELGRSNSAPARRTVPLSIGGGLAACILAAFGGLLLLTMTGQTNNESNIPQGPVDVPIIQIPETVIAPTPPPPPTATTPAAPIAPVNLIDQIDLERDVLTSLWNIRDGELIGSGGGNLVIPYTPPSEYDLDISFTTNSTLIALLLVKDGQQFWYGMKGWSHIYNGPYYVDGKPLDQSPTTTVYKLNDGQRYDAHFEVRNDRFRVWIDDNLITDLPADYKRWTVQPGEGLRTTNPNEGMFPANAMGMYVNKHMMTAHSLTLTPVGDVAAQVTHAPAPPILADSLARTVGVGGAGGRAFEHRAEGGAQLVGMATRGMSYSGHPIVREMAAIFRRTDGTEYAWPHSLEGDDVTREVARPGYGVAGLTISHGARVDGLQPVFMRLRSDGSLDPGDQYDGRWQQGKDSGLSRLGSSGYPVVGVHGGAGRELDRLGLIIADTPVTSEMDPTWDGAIDLLDQARLDRDTAAGVWIQRNGGMTSNEGGPLALLRLPVGSVPNNYDVHMRFRTAPAASSPSMVGMVLLTDMRPVVWTMDAMRTELGDGRTGRGTIAAQRDRTPMLEPERDYHVDLRVRDGMVTMQMNDQAAVSMLTSEAPASLADMWRDGAGALAVGVQGSGISIEALTFRPHDPAAAAWAPVKLGVSARIDGSDMIVITRSEMRWHHLGARWPLNVKVDGVDWDPQQQPAMSLAKDSPFRSNVDFKSARVLNSEWRGTVYVEPGDDRVTIIIKDGRNGAADANLEFGFNLLP